jgi:macrodomain Ter protein organizer (MatP/YcbG family)
MSEQPTYKSLKVTFATWQAITRISAETGETRAQIIERLAQEELERIQQRKNAQNP